MKALVLSLFLFVFSSQFIFSQTWTEQVSGVTTDLTSISAVNDNNVWVCGYSGRVLRTTNGGVNWISVNAAPIPGTLNLHSIHAIDSVTAVVAGSGTSSFLYRTTNAGANWTQVFTETGGFIDVVVFGNNFAGYMIGDPVPAGGRWSLWGTTDGGTTWDSSTFYLPAGSAAEAGWNNGYFFDISAGFYFGTNNTRIYKTLTLTSWITQPTTGQINSYDIWFNNALTGFMGGTALLYTTTAGTNWGAPPSALPGTANISGIVGFGISWWVVRQGTAVYFSSNGGTSWATQYTAPAGAYRYIAKPRSPIYNSLFAVRTLGGISKATGLTGISPVNSEIPEKFTLKQNYPNPFNPSTTIRFEIPKGGNSGTSFVQLKVYDQLGREVKTLINDNMIAGVFEVSFDASNLSSGVYYYKITAGDFTATKKMTLVK